MMAAPTNAPVLSTQKVRFQKPDLRVAEEIRFLAT
jgi:hypothetical protein